MTTLSYHFLFSRPLLIACRLRKVLSILSVFTLRMTKSVQSATTLPSTHTFTSPLLLPAVFNRVIIS